MISWLLGALLAFVEAPGGSHSPTAVLLLGQPRERFATLSAHRLLEAAAQLCLRSHRVDTRCDLLVGICGMHRLGLLCREPRVGDLRWARLNFFCLLARWAIDP